MRKASLLRFRGQRFIEANHYALDCIRPKCVELERMVEVGGKGGCGWMNGMMNEARKNEEERWVGG